jgi:hypothetical protein
MVMMNAFKYSFDEMDDVHDFIPFSDFTMESNGLYSIRVEYECVILGTEMYILHGSEQDLPLSHPNMASQLFP